jgi:hypothetical protein
LDIFFDHQPAIQTNRTPVESTSHSTSHSVTPPPSTTQAFPGTASPPPSSSIVGVKQDQKPLTATPSVDAAQLRHLQAEAILSKLPLMKFMLSNEVVT